MADMLLMLSALRTMMTSTSILEALQQHLGPDAIQQMSQQLGTDPAATSKAISMAIPVLINGLAHNASNPQGAMDLDNALGAHDGSILDNLGGLLGNAGSGPGGGIAGAILGHILGSRRGPVEQGVGKATGINAQQVSQLLMMLAPIVMGVLGRMKKDRGIGPQQLPEVLAQGKAEIEKQAPATAGLGGILDMNHDGQIADDVARIGSSVLGGLFGHRA
jgi:hypothetical protein